MSNLTLNDVTAYIAAAKTAMETVKLASGLIPKGEHQAELQKRIEDAERALRASEVQLAHALGYHLCKCTFPPQIMLSQGRHAPHGEEYFKCASCQMQHPSEEHFREVEERDRQFKKAAEERKSWMV